MPIKGKKSQGGQGDLYDEPKKRYNVMLTPTAKNILETIGEKEGLSVSEVLERYARESQGESLAA